MIPSLSNVVDLRRVACPRSPGWPLPTARMQKREPRVLEQPRYRQVWRARYMVGLFAIGISSKRSKPGKAARTVQMSLPPKLASVGRSRPRSTLGPGHEVVRSPISRLATEIQRKPVMVVTGASYGLGAAIAQRFAGTFQVCALARGRDKLLELVDACKDKSGLGSITSYECDVSSKDDVTSTCNAILDKYGQVDVLINNASTYECSKVQDLSLDSIDRMVDVNLKGTMYMTHSILPSMINAKAGKIVMVNSVAGTGSWTVPGETIYCASKHGQTGFASALANEVREHGITVTSLHPGGIDTPLQVKAGTPDDVRAQFLSAEDVVDAIEYVVNADSRVLVKTINLWRSAFWH